jgi:hypothetical protein
MVFPSTCNVIPCEGLKEIWIKNGDFVVGFRLYGAVHDNILDALAFVTRGVEDQEQVMRKLTQKFGPPTKFEKTPRQNAYGAQFLIYHASWLNGSTAVFFDVDDSNFTRGSVLIETQAEFERVAKAPPHSREKL